MNVQKGRSSSPYRSKKVEKVKTGGAEAASGTGETRHHGSIDKSGERKKSLKQQLESGTIELAGINVKVDGEMDTDYKQAASKHLHSPNPLIKKQGEEEEIKDQTGSTTSNKKPKVDENGKPLPILKKNPKYLVQK